MFDFLYISNQSSGIVYSGSKYLLNRRFYGLCNVCKGLILAYCIQDLLRGKRPQVGIQEYL